jgi:cytochrome c5
MSKFLKVALASAVLFGAGFAASAEEAKKFGLGRAALPEEVKAWDIDVRPDGQGLPVGQGKVSDGETIYNEQCAVCHGDFGEGKGRWPVLVGGRDTLKTHDPVKTIGSYWPYLSTVFDYVNRAMPFGNAQSLSADETYALTAYILYMSEIVDSDFELSKENFTSIKMPNEANFIEDSRPDTPVLADGKEPCMENCKEGEVKITGRARILDVTPEAATTTNKAGGID